MTDTVISNEPEMMTATPPRMPTGNLPIEALQDVEMKLEVVLGRVRLRLQHLLGMRPGQVIELDRTRSSLVEVLVNGTLFAKGEIVLIDDSRLGVRIAEVVGNEGAKDPR